MYQDHFGFSEIPFSIAPDPRYLFMSAGHREALAHLLYGVGGEGGFVLLTGEVGTGKTTVCRCLLEQMPSKGHLALILNPNVTVLELLSSICDEFQIPYPPHTQSIKTFVDLINGFLLRAHAANERAVLIIDEAQNLDPDVLEQMRLLTNLETSERKLLQIILIGQPELRLMLAKPGLRQVSQRIVARYHLEHLRKNEVEGYVRHRLSVAGGDKDLFDPHVFGLLHSLSGGIPRVINLLCDRALLGAYSQDLKQVDRKTLIQASREIFGDDGSNARNFFLCGKIKSAALALFIVFGLTAIFWENTPWQILSSQRLKATEDSSPLRSSMPVTPPVFHKIHPTTPAQNLSVHHQQVEELAIVQGVTFEDGFRSELGAFESLFAFWGKKFDPDKPSTICAQAEAQGLSCYRGRGSLEELRRLNRPAILRLYDHEEKPFYLTLAALHGNLVELLGQHKFLTIFDHVLADHWRGEFQLLWRPPPHYRGVLRLGTTGPEVQWLREQLDLTDDQAFSNGKLKPYDGNLKEAVRRFQILKGLQPDGIAGPLTLIHLNNSLLHTETPTLREEWQEY